MAKAAKHAAFFNRLRELFSYDPDTGVFRYIKSPYRGHLVGSVAGTKTLSGYSKIVIGGREYRAHRIAWLWMTGAWPKGEIDNINLDKSDNRWCNLRLATGSQNTANTRAKPFNKSGVKGVCWHKLARKWRATITVNRKQHHLGFFCTLESAAAAYAAAAEQHFGEFARVE